VLSTVSLSDYALADDAASATDAKPTPATYRSSVLRETRVRRKVYGGIGFGRAWLEPDTGRAPGVGPNDRVQLGGQLTLGLDVNKWVSLEVHAADLGAAGLSNGGEIAYRQFGGSSLFYIGANRHRYNRSGLTGYGRAGVGYLSNQPSENLNVQKKNATHLLLGLGLEYALRNGLAVRAETIVFDADVNYTQLSLMYRFGKQRERQSSLLVEKSTPTVEKAPLPVVPQVPAVAVLPLDDDKDGVLNDQDACPGTELGSAVDDRGCELFGGVLEGVNFHTGSADLTDQARSKLDEVAATLMAYPTVSFELSAHTDSDGNEGPNQRLSQRRAESVSKYLIDSGILQSRFSANAYGESRPIAPNSTAEGRRQNRRVELHVVR